MTQLCNARFATDQTTLLGRAAESSLLFPRRALEQILRPDVWSARWSSRWADEYEVSLESLANNLYSAVGGTPFPVERDIVISNPGTAPLFVSTINENGGDFFIPANHFPPLPIEVDPGRSVHIVAEFDASSAGPITGSMDFVDNASGSPHTIQFTGTGITNDFAYNLTSTPSVTVTAGQAAFFDVELALGSQSSG